MHNYRDDGAPSIVDPLLDKTSCCSIPAWSTHTTSLWSGGSHAGRARRHHTGSISSSSSSSSSSITTTTTGGSGSGSAAYMLGERGQDLVERVDELRPVQVRLDQPEHQRPAAAPKEMMQPCLVYLHAISLVALTSPHLI